VTLKKVFEKERKTRREAETVRAFKSGLPYPQGLHDSFQGRWDKKEN
jgi:hypothetical protein